MKTLVAGGYLGNDGCNRRKESSIMNIGERYASFAICPSWFQVVRPGILGGFSVDPDPLKIQHVPLPGSF